MKNKTKEFIAGALEFVFDILVASFCGLIAGLAIYWLFHVVVGVP